eukprot:gene10163-11203_t
MGRRLAFNIRGVYYETREETLMRFPNTLLGDPMLRAPFCNVENNQFYFDRSHQIFDTILFFYQSGGILAKPDNIDDTEFQDELRFFGIIKDPVAKNTPVPTYRKLREKLWMFMDCPSSSIPARVFACFSLLMIVISTVTYCLETVNIPPFKAHHNFVTITGHLQTFSLWITLEFLYAGWFTIEYMLRCFTQPKRRTFIFSVLGLVDLAAILPFYGIIILVKYKIKTGVRLLRVVQIFRILKVTRYSTSLQLLGKSLYYCKGQISLLLVFFFINCLACGSVLYWIEKNASNSRTESIMDTLWFCIISMTTVGYGDIVPQTALGKIMASVTILVGIVALFHIFIPVYLSYFALLYELSYLTEIEKEELCKEQEQMPQPQKHAKASGHSSSLRRPRPSVTTAPNLGKIDAYAQGKKASITTDDTFMRKIKYDYLRKISSTESPLDWKSSAMELSNETSTSIRGGIRRRAILDSAGNSDIDEDSDNVIAKQTNNCVRGRRKAVVVQPDMMQGSQNKLRKISDDLSRYSRSISPIGCRERSLSTDNESRISKLHRKAMSLQLYNLEYNDGVLEEVDSLSEI